MPSSGGRLSGSGPPAVEQASENKSMVASQMVITLFFIKTFLYKFDVLKGIKENGTTKNTADLFKEICRLLELSDNNEIVEIKQKCPDIKIEMFIHGAMCISYSGRCLLSNYLVNRDANRGECAQPCRWEYAIMEVSGKVSFLPKSKYREVTCNDMKLKKEYSGLVANLVMDGKIMYAMFFYISINIIAFFLSYLYLPTGAISYLLGSKK